MTRSSPFALALLVGAVLAACAGPARLDRDPLRPDARLTCSLERGMGGTGITDGERGMGGTGLMAAADERGMGGTGVTAGVIGTVTGFGSICVSGVRVAYDDTTAVTAESLPASLDALARGMTVAATVVQQGDELRASHINILHALVGPVTSTTPFTVMNAPIETADAAGVPAASLSVGDVVAVDGLQRPDGVIDATRIARAAPEAGVSVRGSAEMPAPGVLRIGAVPVAVSPGSGASFAGLWVAVTGFWNGDRVTPSSISAEPELRLSPNTRLSIEGYLLPRPAGGFAVRGVPVRENVERRLPPEVIARLAAGQRVQVIGVNEADGAVRPQTIVVPDFGSPLRSDLSQETAVPDTAAEAITDTAARRRAAAAAAAAATPAREAIQPERGTYGTTITRPEALRSVTPAVPETVRTRPAPPTRPAPLVRPEAPARPEVPVRPDARPPQRPRGG